MAIPRSTLQEITERIYNRVILETDLNADLDGSIIGVVCKALGAEIASMWDYIEELYNQSNLTTATGNGLDQLGLITGVARKSESRSTTLGQTKSVRFTNLGVSNVTIPTSTRVWKSSNINLAFFTVEGGTVLPGQTLDLHVSAAQPGQAFNIGVGELDSHNVPTTLIRVTNILPIQNGSLTESDDSYRDRILQEFRRRNTLNLDNAVALMRSVDAVRDVLPLNLNRGSGSFDVIIVPWNQSQANDAVTQCQRLLDDAVGVGISAKAKLPIPRALDLKLTVTFLPTFTNQESVRQSIKAQITSRMDSLPIEDGSGASSIFMSQLRSIASSADPNVIDATISGELDGSPLYSDGEIKVGLGEQIVLRTLVFRQ